ncbi:potassium-transporting ATPase subunit KdpA [Acetobacterium fimetarium]|uniref:Potassium-transporting ATPase potassium-binding subunit n=1 Tax=Acetobacterium fimetarium TaxID=52691 RepID=A0ABR6WSF5_9FIRM|nr:potassium-transporting ATPase subunit KdpA [Acetobacterium fimetarium]MBC3803293.1 potassium-transporting ATPase subunit KdpA [Acetobacterium fimetarium]
MSMIIVQDLLFLIIVIGLSVPLGIYIHQVMAGQKVFLTRLISPVENRIYRVLRVPDDEAMSPQKYIYSVLSFCAIGLIFVFSVQMLQYILPLNPEHLKAPSWDLAFNTAASFVSNTNWQAYSGESSLSYLTQTIGLCVQNFLSAATGIAVLFALIRGFTAPKQLTIGNFWQDITRITLYVLVPLSVIFAIAYVSQGVVQSFSPYQDVTMLENGMTQTIPLGPAASQIAIKQLGTNGGGFFGANSAFSLENPTPLTNFLQLLSILLIPAALCVAFGQAVKDSKQGRAIYVAMILLFVLALAGVTLSEALTAPVFSGVATTGNMEGKQIIHGVGTSALWGTATTAASNGSVNAMLDSFTPLSGLIFMFLMQIGEVVFGGVGSGLSGMLAFVILTVFIAGLMVGRTPEYLGKKIEPFDMKMVCLIVLTPLLCTLSGTAFTVLLPQASAWTLNTGAHGFSEILYAFSSMGNNNGSAFSGFQANTVFTNVAGGIIMLIVRFVPMAATLFLAGNLSKKKFVASTEGTLRTNNSLFVGLLICVILLLGALSFLPALVLGPIADFYTSLS